MQWQALMTDIGVGRHNRARRELLIRWAEEGLRAAASGDFGHGGLAQELVANGDNNQSEINLSCSSGAQCVHLKKGINYKDGFFDLASKSRNYWEFKDAFVWRHDNEVEEPCVHIDKAAYDQIYSTMQSITSSDNIYETGGLLILDRASRLLKLDKKAQEMGETQSINIPLGEYEFHCHPNKCDSGARGCGLGPPSTTDVRTIAKRQCGVNRAHIVFAFEGTFVVFMARGWKKLGQTAVMNAVESYVLPQIDAVVKRFMETDDYQAFLKDWMLVLNSESSPLRVFFYPIGTTPCVPPPEAKSEPPCMCIQAPCNCEEHRKRRK